MPTVKELKAELTELGLSTDGLKADLQARIDEHHASQAEPTPADVAAAQAEVAAATAAPESKLFKQIKGVTYDRILLETADQLIQSAADGKIDVAGAKKLFENTAEDPAVTECKSRTLQYVLDNYACAADATSHLSALMAGQSDPAEAAAEAAAAKAKAEAEAAARAAKAEAEAMMAEAAAEKAAKAEALAQAKAQAAREAATVAEAAAAARAEEEAEEDGGEDAMEVDAGGKISEYQKKKNAKKKAKKKAKKLQQDADGAQGSTDLARPSFFVDYVAGDPESLDDPAFAEFRRVFGHFIPPEELCGPKQAELREKEAEKAAIKAEKVAAGELDVNGDAIVEDGDEANQMSKRKKKLLSRMSIAELKQQVKKPDAVEAWDVTAYDPVLLIHLKGYKNSVGVPRHWCQKRKYLQGKRGIDRQQFQLPDFIAKTGITEIRSTSQNKDGDMSLKQQARQRMAPKMGKMDIDYQVLHDAFFRYQEKPKMSGMGDMYHEGKEFEIHLREKRPGQVSEELRKALGMVEGQVCAPPWLVNMQRYGPPPSWPNLKIPGLNAPIPHGGSYGYHPGGWGKPPVDEYGRPLYGDVFGTGINKEPEAHKLEVQKLREHGYWGELQEDEEEEESEEEEEEEEEISGDETEETMSVDQSGASSVLSGMETPESMDLRKPKQAGDSSVGSEPPAPPAPPKALFQVLEQKDSAVGGGLMGSSHKYEVNLDPGEIEGLDAAQVTAKFQQAQAKASGEKEDIEDLLEAQDKKRKAGEQGRADKNKKQKDFKF